MRFGSPRTRKLVHDVILGSFFVDSRDQNDPAFDGPQRPAAAATAAAAAPDAHPQLGELLVERAQRALAPPLRDRVVDAHGAPAGGARARLPPRAACARAGAPRQPAGAAAAGGANPTARRRHAGTPGRRQRPHAVATGELEDGQPQQQPRQELHLGVPREKEAVAADVGALKNWINMWGGAH